MRLSLNCPIPGEAQASKPHRLRRPWGVMEGIGWGEGIEGIGCRMKGGGKGKRRDTTNGTNGHIYRI